jgi:hypothetical protein
MKNKKGVLRSLLVINKEQLIIDTVIMEQARKNNRNIYTAFIDYKKAYDSVPHSWLLKILKMYKINLDLINFLSHVMSVMTF